MATVERLGTKFTFSVLPCKDKEGLFARAKIALENEYLRYEYLEREISRAEIEELYVSLSRLLAGGYERSHSVSLERAGMVFDLRAHTENGYAVSREKRRKEDCLAIVQMLFKSADGKRFLEGVHTFILHREEIERFAETLGKEYETAFQKFLKGKGKYRFVGVSPLGYKGCRYWYFDPTGKAKAGDYVWVRMGRHDTEQIVYVDSARWFGDDAPYDPNRVKQVLGFASKEDLKEYEE